jgi:Fanconi anemia group J protein
VPHGVLCFFSSYKVLEKMVTRWQRTGLWQQINALKAVMVEPRAGDRVDFDDLLRSYYDTIQHTTSAGV